MFIDDTFIRSDRLHYCNHTLTQISQTLIHSTILGETLPDLRPDPTDTLHRRNLAVVPYGSEIIGRRIGRKPLLHIEVLMFTLKMNTDRRDVHVVNKPGGVYAGAVRGQTQ